MNSGTATFGLRLVIAGVFFLAGASKLATKSVDEQLWLLDAIGITTNRIIRAAVRSLPFIEICLAFWLLSNWLIVFVLIITVFQVLMFLLVSIKAMRHRYKGPCGCFGNSTRSLGLADLIFNLMLLLSVLTTLYSSFNESRQVASVLQIEIPDLLMAIVIAGGWFGVNTMLIKMQELAAAH